MKKKIEMGAGGGCVEECFYGRLGGREVKSNKMIVLSLYRTFQI